MRSKGRSVMKSASGYGADGERSVVRLARGQIDVKGGAAPALGFEADGSLKARDDVLDDGKAKAGAGEPSAIGAIGLREFFEDPLAKGFWNAWTFVCDGNAYVRAGAGEGDGHRFALGREFRRVGQEIGDDLNEAVGVD